MSLHASAGLSFTNGTGLPGGASGTLQYNANGIFGGFANATTDGVSLFLNGTTNATTLLGSGYSQTGGSAQPMVDFAGTLNTTGSPDVVAIRIVNTASGASTRLLNLYAGANGTTSQFAVSTAGQGIFNGGVTLGSGNSIIWLSRSVLAAPADGAFNFQNNAGTIQTPISVPLSGTWQFGRANAAAPVAQIVTTQGSRGGTDTNVGGGNLTVQSGQGTGTGTVSQILLQSPLGTASGSTSQVYATGLSIVSGQPIVTPAVATPAGGNTTAGILFGTTAGFGIYYGSGAPTLPAGTGSLYIRSDGGANTRLYSNTNGSTTWQGMTSS